MRPSGEGTALGGFEPARLRPAGIERRQSAAGDADQKPAVGMNRQSPGVALEYGDQRSGRKAGARELQDLPAGGDVDRAVGVGDDVVYAG